MVTTFLLVTAMLFIVLLVTALHLPPWLKRIILWTPAWLQAAFVHVVYGGFFIGGVTGHVVGGLLAVPWFFVVRFVLQPRIRAELADSPLDLRNSIQASIKTVRGWFSRAEVAVVEAQHALLEKARS